MELIALGLLLRLHRIQHHRRFFGRHFFGWFILLDRLLLLLFVVLGLRLGLLLRRLLLLLLLLLLMSRCTSGWTKMVAETIPDVVSKVSEALEERFISFLN